MSQRAILIVTLLVSILVLHLLSHVSELCDVEYDHLHTINPAMPGAYPMDVDDNNQAQRSVMPNKVKQHGKSKVVSDVREDTNRAIGTTIQRSVTAISTRTPISIPSDTVPRREYKQRAQPCLDHTRINCNPDALVTQDRDDREEWVIIQNPSTDHTTSNRRVSTLERKECENDNIPTATCHVVVPVTPLKQPRVPGASPKTKSFKPRPKSLKFESGLDTGINDQWSNNALTVSSPDQTDEKLSVQTYSSYPECWDETSKEEVFKSSPRIPRRSPSSYLESPLLQSMSSHYAEDNASIYETVTIAKDDNEIENETKSSSSDVLLHSEHTTAISPKASPSQENNLQSSGGKWRRVRELYIEPVWWK